jgi:hypothetical protein
MGDLVSLDAARPPAIMAARPSSSLAAAQAGVQASFAVVGFKGRNWRLKHRGDETLLMNADNAPLPHLDVVIVGVSSAIAKQWYKKKYSEGDDGAPDCFSVDGVKPDVSSPEKQRETCAVCPRNAWGSRITEDGKKAKECQDSRRLAVVPLGDIENESYGGPMLLRLPPTSIANFANYASLLQRKGVPGFEFVATRIGFDYDVAYPKITFTAVGWLNDEQATTTLKVLEDPQIERMLQEAVEEATHDPAGAETAPDPLAQGGPPAALQNRATAAATSAETAPAPSAPAPAALTTQAVAPAPAAPAAGNATPATKRAATAFMGAPAGPIATPGPTAAPAASSPATAASPTPPAPAAEERRPAQPPTSIPVAPEDMLSEIDNLLAAPIA